MPAAQVQQDPASPSPTLPLALAPSPRATKLHQVFSDALSHSLKTLSYNNFSVCFPTPAQYKRDALEALHRQFVRELGRRCEDEFESVCRERDVVKGLNLLDALVEEARRRREKEMESERERSGGQVRRLPVPYEEPRLSIPTKDSADAEYSQFATDHTHFHHTSSKTHTYFRSYEISTSISPHNSSKHSQQTRSSSRRYNRSGEKLTLCYEGWTKCWEIWRMRRTCWRTSRSQRSGRRRERLMPRSEEPGFD